MFQILCDLLLSRPLELLKKKNGSVTNVTVKKVALFRFTFGKNLVCWTCLDFFCFIST